MYVNLISISLINCVKLWSSSFFILLLLLLLLRVGNNEQKLNYIQLAQPGNAEISES